jgi:hypothetical protein
VKEAIGVKQTVASLALYPTEPENAIVVVVVVVLVVVGAKVVVVEVVLVVVVVVGETQIVSPDKTPVVVAQKLVPFE